MLDSPPQEQLESESGLEDVAKGIELADGDLDRIPAVGQSAIGGIIAAGNGEEAQAQAQDDKGDGGLWKMGIKGVPDGGDLANESLSEGIFEVGLSKHAGEPQDPGEHDGLITDNHEAVDGGHALDHVGGQHKEDAEDAGDPADVGVDLLDALQAEG